ncbi:MAG: hypothetical protein EPN88_11700 [Bacteroidetes bacterium]|nr:MAG: hypothetical protein EPN88_11700 [Bacteroidota bacterium]
MRHFIVFVFVVLMVGLPSCKYFKSNKKEIAAAMLRAKQDSIRIADSIRTVQERLMAIENARLDSVRKADEEKLAWESKFKYNIIVGSFITPEYAKGLTEVYRNKGYEPRILKMEGSRFELVSAEVHDSFRKAVARLKEFQDTIEADAWMYIKK